MPRLLHIGGITGEGDGEIVAFHFGGEFHILAILIGNGTGGESAALAVDTLVVGEFTAHGYPGVDLIALDPFHPQDNTAIIE